MLDIENEVYIAEEFWNFLAGFDVHDQLLDCFERAGLELRDEIDAYFYFGRFRASDRRGRRWAAIPPPPPARHAVTTVAWSRGRGLSARFTVLLGTSSLPSCSRIDSLRLRVVW